MTFSRTVVRVIDLSLDPPTEFDAGTTVMYRPSLAYLGYPASDGWALKVFLAGPAFVDGAVLATGTAGTPDGDAFIVAMAAEDTAVLTPGTYTWIEQVSKADLVKNARKCDVNVGYNVVTATAGQLESHDEVMLVLVRAQIKKRAQKDIARLSAINRAIDREDLDKWHNLELYYMERVATRRRGSDQRTSIRQAFTRP